MLVEARTVCLFGHVVNNILTIHIILLVHEVESVIGVVRIDIKTLLVFIKHITANQYCIFRNDCFFILLNRLGICNKIIGFSIIVSSA